MGQGWGLLSTVVLGDRRTGFTQLCGSQPLPGLSMNLSVFSAKTSSTRFQSALYSGSSKQGLCRGGSLPLGAAAVTVEELISF